MAVAFDAISYGNNSSSSMTWAHIVGAGANRLLTVKCGYRYAYAVTGVTYNGVAMTQAGSAVDDGSNSVAASYWYLVNPPTGTYNVVVTMSASRPGVCVSTSWTGVDQTTPLGTPQNATGTGTATSVAVSSETGEFVDEIVMCRSDTIDRTISANGAQTKNIDVRQTNGGATAGIRVVGSRGAGVATYTSAWTLSASERYAQLAYPINAAGTGSTPPSEATAASVTPASGQLTVTFTMPANADANAYEIRGLTTAYPAADRSNGTVLQAATAAAPSETVIRSINLLTNSTRYFLRLFVRNSANIWSEAGVQLTSVPTTLPTLLAVRKLEDGTAVTSGQKTNPNPIFEYQLAAANFESGKVGFFRFRTGNDAATPPTGSTKDYVSSTGGSVFRYENPAASGTYVDIPTTGLTTALQTRKIRIYTTESGSVRQGSLRVEQNAT